MCIGRSLATFDLVLVYSLMAAPQKTVIVAEDEPLVRMLAADMLADSGFEVVEAAHAGEVLAALEHHEGRVAALFTDVHMPGGCDGMELARLVYAQWPRVAVLVTSGLHRPAKDDLPPGGVFVSKPYELERIVGHLRALIP